MTRTIKFAVASLIALAVLCSAFILAFSDEHYMPHAVCWRGNSILIWGMAIGNTAIFACYAIISAGLFRLIYAVNLGPFAIPAAGFGMFIATCGLTHLADVFTIWYSAFWWQVAGVWLCVIPSVITTVYLLIRAGGITRLAEKVFRVYDNG